MRKKEMTTVLTKHISIVNDVDYYLEAEEKDAEITILVSYKFWPDSYGVRGSEFTNGEPTGYMVNADDDCIQLMHLIINHTDLWDKVDKWIQDKMCSEDWMSEATEAAFNDCYEDYDPERSWR